ncbi:hypothetical protein C6A34_12085 (plasmid) [Bacillus thuringiensis]|nr:hypothetical protein C6A34_12085 [Bacillus thuringiensis]
MICLIFYAGTKCLGFRTLFSSCNLLYQVIKELHIVSLSRVFGYAKPKFIKNYNQHYSSSFYDDRPLV